MTTGFGMVPRLHTSSSSSDRLFTGRRLSVTVLLLIIGITALAPSVRAQPAPNGNAAALAAAAVEHADTSRPPATLTYGNRPIIEFRATVLGRPPADRAAVARQVLNRLVEEDVTGPVESHTIGQVMTIAVGSRDIFAILPSDVDDLAGDTLPDTAARAVSQLQTALNELAELHRPGRLLLSALQALLVTAVFVFLVWLLKRFRAGVSARLTGAAGRKLHASKVGDLEFVRSSRIIELLERTITGLVVTLGLFIGYFWLTFVLRRFPYSRPWGESLREFLLGRLSLVGFAILNALPNLFTVVVILMITRFVARSVQLLFQAVEAGRIEIPGVYPETAQPTRKLIIAALWLFAVVLAYPYLPGSESEAFKGVSVFVGLVLSLGSSGIVNQVMSGLTLTYSRALRVGDFVNVADIEGTVTQLGTLSVKIRTSRREDITIPNNVIVGQTVTNYSRLAETEGVFVPTSITIGYDVAWRQVQALLLLAAARTPGVRREPAPVVRQSALEDFYVKYTLLVCLERPAQRSKILAAVHANILDAFNEYGVQITSPNYEADPEGRKVVPRDQWFAAPAIPEPAEALENAALRD